TSEDGVMVWQMDPAAEDPVRPSAVSETSSSILLPILVALGVLLAGGAVAAAMMVRRRSSAPTEGVAMPGAEPQGEEGPA
ncbi:MAG: hypothetical protein ACLFWM_12305, partial [Actinomycetota bacterium]